MSGSRLFTTQPAGQWRVVHRLHVPVCPGSQLPLRCVVCGGAAFDCACIQGNLPIAGDALPGRFPRRLELV